VASASDPALPAGFRIERHKHRTVLHCPVANGRRLEIERQDEDPGATVEPLLNLAMYVPGRRDFITFATARLSACRMERWPNVAPNLWVTAAGFELTQAEDDAVVCVFPSLAPAVQS
jgi:hypothetical protein